MSVALDANLLLYASDESSRFHEKAQTTLEECTAGPEPCYLFWPVAMAYLRIATHPGVFVAPLSLSDALANVDALLTRPAVRAVGEDDGFWRVFRAAAQGAGVRGNLVPDAQVAALMLQYGAQTIVSHDRDFRKFDGIKVLDPFA